MTEFPADAVLVQRVLAGDVQSFSILVRRYRERYARFAVRMLGNREDAEEALQDSFVRAYRSLARCEDPEHFGSWLYAILANQCRTAATRRSTREKRILYDEDLMDAPSGENESESLAWKSEIEYALSKLTPDQREAFLLKHVEDLSYEEMETITGEGSSTLKMRVKRACDKMREQLEGANK